MNDDIEFIYLLYRAGYSPSEILHRLNARNCVSRGVLYEMSDIYDAIRTFDMDVRERRVVQFRDHEIEITKEQ